MNYLVVLLIFVWLCVCVNATFDPNTFCQLVVNGTKIKDPRACNTWIECIDGTPVSGTCKKNLFYNRNTKECVDPTSIKCISSNPCAALGNTDGFVADPYSCNGYYYCSNGNAVRGECGTGMNYNPGTQVCIRNFPCVSKMDPDSYCNILPDGVFVKNKENCNGWQMCWNNEVLNGTCPGTFYFNPQKGNCDYPKDVDCQTEAPPIAKPGICHKEGAFVSDNKTCNGYYYCAEVSSGEFSLKHGICANKTFFDPDDGGACVPRTKIYCQYDRCAGLGLTTIQLANESDDGCIGFAICQNGVTIGHGTCPTGEYFDEMIQRCTKLVITYAACATTTPATTTTTTTTTSTTGTTTITTIKTTPTTPATTRSS